jgi:hypothetical protein
MSISNFVAWGRFRQQVRREVAEVLNDLPLWMKEKLWATMTQGKGSNPNSKGTHREGWCVDFDLDKPGWDIKGLTAICAELEKDGKFACGPRSNKEVGTAGSHLHIAYRGKANYWLIRSARSVRSLKKRIAKAIQNRDI